MKVEEDEGRPQILSLSFTPLCVSGNALLAVSLIVLIILTYFSLACCHNPCLLPSHTEILSTCFASWEKIDRYNSSAALTGRLRKKNAIILLVYLKNMQEIALLTSACLLIGYLLPEKKDAMGLSIFIFLNLMSPGVNLKVIAKHFKALPYLHSSCLPAHAHTSSPNTESKSSLNINLSS